MTIFARPSEWTRADKPTAFAKPLAGASAHYFAFLSYSHRDEEIAEWLHEALESFRVPSHLVGRLTEHGSVPRRLTPVFRDLQELAASDDLGTEIREALAASRFLVVLCSPAAAVSRWTNAEIEAFKRIRPDGCIFAVIVDGEPFASDIPGREADECLPRALRFKYDRRGRPTAKRAEPLAADIRGDSEDRRMGFLKLVAGMVGVGLDDLVRRADIRRQKRLAILAAASLAGMAVTSVLAVTAIQGRDAARDQRREAESLIGFMLGDLRSKLEPVGRLDALDGVGSRVLAYYQKQDMSDLSDAALLQRSRALQLIGEIANLRGNSPEALRQYQAALAGTGEALRRNPDDPERLYDHAQNIFWIGEIARQRGNLDGALKASQIYKSLAGRMVALEPDNMRWRMETQYADANLGIVLLAKRRFEEAVHAFRQALATIQGLAAADPANSDYQKGIVESLAWLADAQSYAGHLNEASRIRQQQLQLLAREIARSGGDVEFREDQVHAYRALGHIYAAQGRMEPALFNMRAAVDQADSLVQHEPGNRIWVGTAARARLELAKVLLESGDKDGAAQAAQSGCSINDGLTARDRTFIEWRIARRDCETIRAQLALASGDGGSAKQLAEEALATAQSIKTGDAFEDAYGAALAQRLIGDAKARAGDAPEARAAWQASLARLPVGVAEKPTQMSERAELLKRLGRAADAQRLEARLASIGYRQTL